MKTGLIWVTCLIAALGLSMLGRALKRPSVAAGQDRAEAILTSLPVIATSLLGMALAGPLDRTAAGIVLGALLLAIPWGWHPSPRVQGMKPIAFMLAACGIAVAGGIQIESFRLPLTQLSVGTGPAAVPLTILWLFVTTVSFRTTRRLEGLPLPLAAVAATAFALIILIQRQHLALARGLATGLAGGASGLVLLALLGLRPPAREGTASVIGFVLGAAAVLGTSKTSVLLSLFIPLLVLSVPVLSMTTLVLDRIPHRVVVTEVRQDLYGILQSRGLPKHKAIILIVAVQACLAAIAVLLAIFSNWSPLTKIVVSLLAATAGVLVFPRLLRLLLLSSRRSAPEAKLLEMRVDPMGMHEAVQRIEEFIRSREPHHVVTSDTMALGRALEDQAFRDVVNAAQMVTADGIGVIWAARIFGLPVRERVSGIDLMEELFQRSAKEGYRLYFFGGQPGVADEAARQVGERHPGVQIVGTMHGYYEPSEEDSIVERIRRAVPDVLFVALGSPRQDTWIHRHIASLGVPVCIGVGGSLDVLARRLRRAPRWMQQLGLEWVYRGIQEPWRMQRWSRFPRVISASLKRKIWSYWS